MGKMNELSQVITELRDCGKALVNMADSLQEIFSAAANELAAETSVQKEPEKKEALTPAKPALTFIDVRKLLSEKSRAGHTAEVKALLQKYGADKLSELSENHYAAVAAEAEVL